MVPSEGMISCTLKDATEMEESTILVAQEHTQSLAASAVKEKQLITGTISIMSARIKDDILEIVFIDFLPFNKFVTIIQQLSLFFNMGII